MKWLALLAVALAAGGGARVDAGQATYGLAAAGGSIWVGGLERDVLRVDPVSGKVLARVTVGPRVFNLAAGGGAVWAVSSFLSTLTRIDVRTGKAAAPLRVGASPYDVEWGFGSAWVSNAGDGTVWRITNGRVVKKLKVGVEPNGITAYRESLWVSDHTLGKLLRVDPRTNRVTGTVALPGADWITGFGGSLYVSQETNVVTRLDAKTLKMLGRAAVCHNPLGSAVVAGRLWVPCIDGNQIDVVDPATMKVVTRKPGGPGPIVVLPAFGHVWVSHSTGNQVWRL